MINKRVVILPNTNMHYMAHLNPDNVPVGTTFHYPHIMNQTLICMFLSLKANSKSPFLLPFVSVAFLSLFTVTQAL